MQKSPETILCNGSGSRHISFGFCRHQNVAAGHVSRLSGRMEKTGLRCFDEKQITTKSAEAKVTRGLSRSLGIYPKEVHVSSCGSIGKETRLFSTEGRL